MVLSCLLSIVAYFRVEQIDFEIEFRLTNFIWGLTIPDCTFELIVILTLNRATYFEGRFHHHGSSGPVLPQFKIEGEPAK